MGNRGFGRSAGDRVDRLTGRRGSIRRALILLVLLSMTACARVAPRHEKLNVLLITIDTVRADHVGAWGGSTAQTPAIDALARSGTRFADAMTAVPLTLPSHATILSGEIPPDHGVRNNGYGSFPGDRPTLATRFTAAGYRTAAFVGAFVLDHRFGLARGFATYDDAIDRRPDLISNFEAERPANVVVDHALAWLSRSDARPFFAWVHMYDAHAPYTPPEPFRTEYRDHPYDGEISFVDSQIARLVERLDRSGVRRNTLIVVLADHGEALGEHGELTHGLLLYEPTIRVPLLFNAPGHVPSALVLQTPVSLADVAPTIVSLAGIGPLVGQLDGRDLSPAILARTEPPSHTLYAETEYPTVFGWSDLATIRQGGSKYIEAPTPELYDLSSDPHESVNLRTERRREANSLKIELASLRKSRALSPPPAMDAESAAKLASLGYVGSLPARNGSGRDPKEMVPLFREFEQATWAMNEHRLPAAIAAFERLVKDDPANPVFRGSLARALRQHGELDRAIELYRETIALNPDDPEAWYNLAVAFQEAGRSAESTTAIEEAIRRDPGRPEAHNTLGIALAASGKGDDAIAQFEEALRIDPQNAHAWNNLGNVYRGNGKLDEAEKAYRRAIEISPSYADPLNGLGALEVQRDRPRSAIPLFDRAIALAPSDLEILLNRGIALEMLGERDSAIAQYRQFIDAAGDRPEYSEQRSAANHLLAHLSGGTTRTQLRNPGNAVQPQ
ncbi:MAG: sulfatase-like hydrolase/transferase [Thermoanaerobaculia bacterium]